MIRDRRLRPTRGLPLSNLAAPRPELTAESEPVSAAKTASLGRILGVDEIAELFGKSRETVKRNLRSRKLHGFKFGKSWFVREADLQLDIHHALESGRRLCREEEQ
jgi:excisionase family DNA binding protein